MFEKVNPSHPDKVADRIAGALVDLAYEHKARISTRINDPKVAIEVLIGHGECVIKGESNFPYALYEDDVKNIVWRICENSTIKINLDVVKQDEHLARNQKDETRCGDNGIFKGVLPNAEENMLAEITKKIYGLVKSDGKYILDLDRKKLIVCQSRTTGEQLEKILENDPLTKDLKLIVNPIGDWTGGTDVDTGATNRKLGSDMGRAVTGGGLHGKDLSKADVTLNIYAHLLAEDAWKDVELMCAIGDEEIDGRPYEEIVDIARDYIRRIGGFEKLAEYGLIR